MKILLVALLIITSSIIIVKQPLGIQWIAAYGTNSSNHEHETFQDERIPLLIEKISTLEAQQREASILEAQQREASILEAQQREASILEAQQRKISTLEKQIKKITNLEARLSQLALLEEKINLLESGSVLAKKADKAWKLTDIFSKLRQYRQRVIFSQAFPVKPKVTLGIVLLDLPGEKVRFLARAEKIDPLGFTLILETQSDSRVEEVQVDWLAFSTQSRKKEPRPE